MGFATRRVWVLALCVLAVALAGAMFPATGIGTVPSVGFAPADGASDAGQTGGTGPSDPTDETGEGSRTDVSGGTPTPSSRTPGPAGQTPTAPAATPAGERTETGTPTRTPTPTVTPTPTPTATPGTAGDSGEAGLLLGVLVGVSLRLLLAGTLLVSLPLVTLEGKARRWPVFRWLPVPAVSVVSVAQTVPQATTAVLVGLSGSAPRLAAGLGKTLSATVQGLGVVGSGLLRGLGGLAVGIPGSLAGSLSSLGGFSLWRGSETTLAGDGDDASGGTAGEEGGADAPAGADEGPTTVEEAWLAMVERVPVGGRRTKTPMELARAAVDHGFPAEPVYAVTEAFRQVAYGGATPTDERTERALAALERLRNALEGEE